MASKQKAINGKLLVSHSWLEQCKILSKIRNTNKIDDDIGKE